MPFFILWIGFLAFSYTSPLLSTTPETKINLTSVQSLGSVQIRLNHPVFINGVLTTDQGGIITGEDLYLQAKRIRYVKKTENESFIHTIDAEEELYLIYKGNHYKGLKAHINVAANRTTIWEGCTKNSLWYVGGKEISIQADGVVVISSSYMSTSENQSNDWSITAKKLVIQPEKSIEAENVSFRFENIPFFWVPSYKRELTTLEKAPFHYRVRHEGRLGLIFEMRYDFFPIENWKNTGIINYSLDHGLGIGLVSEYKEKRNPQYFQSNVLAAQRKENILRSKKPGYRLQGVYQNYYPTSSIHVRAMYDKLSDSRMKKMFSYHSPDHAKAGLTQIAFWKKEENWIARMNTRLRINSFQTVQQQLPLFSFTQRPFPITTFPLFVENRFSSGYLDYKYAKKVDTADHCSSMRSEISQRIFSSHSFFPFVIAPSIGYRVIQYGSRPNKQGTKGQILGEAFLKVHTRCIRSSITSFEAIEPYYTLHSLTHPGKNLKKTYTFNIQDGFARYHENRFGFRYSYSQKGENPRIFQKKIYSDVYTKSYFKTRHLSSHPKKIWINTFLDLSPTSGYKIEYGYDFQHGRTDHCAIQARYTLSKKASCTFEYRSKSPYSWRKLDYDNCALEARNSMKVLLQHFSDKRKTFISTFLWTPTPDLDLELKSNIGLRSKSHRSKSVRLYHDIEISCLTLIRGALQLKCSYAIRSGSQHHASISVHLGGKKNSTSSLFHKIGQGNYDIR